MNGTGADWEAGTLLKNGREAGLVAAEPLHHAHHAVMLAVPAAARGKIRVASGPKMGAISVQLKAMHQRKCDRAAHLQATI